MVTTPTKRPPSAQELVFVEDIRRLCEGKLTRQSDIKSTGRWQQVTRELLHTFQEDGQSGFDKAYDAYARDNSRMAELRSLIGVASAPKGNEPAYHGTLLSDVNPEKVDWLWKPRLVLGKITMFDGDPGLGKSLIGANLGARITRGLEMPDGTPCLSAGGVVVIMPEDGLNDTIQPRFARAGADLRRVSSLGTIHDADEHGKPCERPFMLPRDLPVLESEIDRVKAKLVYIDPVMAIIGGDKNTYKDNEVREILLPLKLLVERKKVSCVLVRHLTKQRGGNPLMAGNGSVAFIGLARTGLLVAPDPDTEGQAIFAHIKSNIGPIAPSLTYKVCSDDEKGDDRPYIVWNGTTTLTGADLMAPPRKNTGTNRQEILELLKAHAPNDMTIDEILEDLPDISRGNLKMTLKRMYDKGEIDKSERGAYHAR